MPGEIQKRTRNYSSASGCHIRVQVGSYERKSYGATLIAGPNISETYLGDPKTLIHECAKTNYRSISDEYCDVRENGLWIITKVFQTLEIRNLKSMSCNGESARVYLGSTEALLGRKSKSEIWRFFQI